MITGSNASVLIVEDDEGVAVLERRALERRGFTVIGASTSDEAIAAVQNLRQIAYVRMLNLLSRPPHDE